MADEIEGEDGRDRGLAEGQREWLQQRLSLGPSAILHGTLPLPMAPLNHFLNPKIKTQL